MADCRNLRDAAGAQLYPAGIGAAYGLAEVGVPELKTEDILCLDACRVYLIVRSDFGVDTSQDYGFRQDALAVRVRCGPAVTGAVQPLLPAAGLPIRS